MSAPARPERQGSSARHRDGLPGPIRIDRFERRRRATMKPWHQSFAQLDTLPGYVAAIREHLDRVAPPGDDDRHTQHAARQGHRLLVRPAHAQPAVPRKRASCRKGRLRRLPDEHDSRPSPADRASVVDISVVGMGFSCMHTAVYVSLAFGIVTFIREMPPLYQDNIRKYGLEHRTRGYELATSTPLVRVASGKASRFRSRLHRSSATRRR